MSSQPPKSSGEIRSNFSHLASLDVQLVRLGALAEKYFADDANTSMVKIRQFGEYLAQAVASRIGVYTSGEEQQIALLRRLQDQGILSREVAQLFHHIRTTGNAANHAGRDDHGAALNLLKFAAQLGFWFQRTFGKADFKSGPFVPPSPPKDESAELREELERLSGELARTADSHLEAQQKLSLLEDQLRVVKDEQSAWEQIALETDQARADLERRLVQAQQVAATQTPAVHNALLHAAQVASSKVELDEAATRKIIDGQLADAGWTVDTVNLRHSKGTRPQRGRNLAIAEWPTSQGPADYVLFVGLRPVAVVEAKKIHVDVSGKVSQAERYSKGFAITADMEAPGGPWTENGHTWQVPFCFATNGRPFIRQIQQKSGIWWRDARHATNQARALESWYTPEGLVRLLEHDPKQADQDLSSNPPDLPLRDYQLDAIKAVEEAIVAGRRNVLVAMATGTGKTKTCVGLLHRLLRTDRFRRILFLVDRNSLGTQANESFQETRLEGLNTFGEMFDVKGVDEQEPDLGTRVHIATVQGMVQRVLYPPEGVAPIPVDRYDCVVIDECHRGYVLDRELNAAELEYTNLDDYLAKYRQVLDRFDAVLVGLTATPALHTVEIFGKPVYTYTYRQAVVDGWLVDHEPPFQIRTALSTGGIHWSAGDELKIYNPETTSVDLVTAPDDIDLDIESFNRVVVTDEFNRVVCEELARHIDPTLPGKTLIFAATDDHADLVVTKLTEAFSSRYGDVPVDTVAKITSKSDRPQELIRRFRNEPNQVKVAVTVDLLTTGIDVPAIVNLVFLRRVKSRILYEQMKGRATRLCQHLFGLGEHKEVFRIYDAVAVYDALERMTNMKPVVRDPLITIQQLVDELVNAAHPDARDAARDTLCAKLRRLDKRKAFNIQGFGDRSGGLVPSELADRLAHSDAATAATWFLDHPTIASYCDRKGSSSGRPQFISDHPDELVGVEQGYGLDVQGAPITKPEDYLHAFADWLHNNNQIPALLVVCTRPRDLTRAQLKELKLVLDTAGFPESALRAATRDLTHVDVAATIIGYIRNQALGSPLIPYEQRVNQAVVRLQAKHRFTPPQRQWLERIRLQLEKEVVVDTAALDKGAFLEHGGFARLDKIFDNRLAILLGDLQEEIWRDQAA
ncbi:MAG: type I restriction-modification system endonuclease [Fibrobacterota bacterium]|nr:MAG: type I restriction-modification system endonuclease [Fibrobacterota bacterium]